MPQKCGEAIEDSPIQLAIATVKLTAVMQRLYDF